MSEGSSSFSCWAPPGFRSLSRSLLCSRRYESLGTDNEASASSLSTSSFFRSFCNCTQLRQPLALIPSNFNVSRTRLAHLRNSFSVKLSDESAGFGAASSDGKAKAFGSFSSTAFSSGPSLSGTAADAHAASHDAAGGSGTAPVPTACRSGDPPQAGGAGDGARSACRPAASSGSKSSFLSRRAETSGKYRKASASSLSASPFLCSFCSCVLASPPVAPNSSSFSISRTRLAHRKNSFSVARRGTSDGCAALAGPSTGRCAGRDAGASGRAGARTSSSSAPGPAGRGEGIGLAVPRWPSAPRRSASPGSSALQEKLEHDPSRTTSSCSARSLSKSRLWVTRTTAPWNFCKASVRASME
mmetsp:Transcript_65261/g.202264  ORF Transcript_65261/g.202264 Transcript_65261/m.202264 type:complete len:358 (-) Transcript_65261:97-1170(-)